jgi:hypothetical protein
MNYNTINLRELAQLGLLAFTFAAAGFGQTPAPVVVRNNSIQVRDLGNNPAQAVMFRFYPVFTAQSNYAEAPQRYLVPVGKRLVIEHIQFDANVHPGRTLQTGITTTLDFAQTTLNYGHNFRQPDPGGVTFDYLSGDRMVRIYADGGTQVKASLYSNGKHPGQGSVIFFGYLVDMPIDLTLHPIQ